MASRLVNAGVLVGVVGLVAVAATGATAAAMSDRAAVEVRTLDGQSVALCGKDETWERHTFLLDDAMGAPNAAAAASAFLDQLIGASSPLRESERPERNQFVVEELGQIQDGDQMSDALVRREGSQEGYLIFDGSNGWKIHSAVICSSVYLRGLEERE